MLSRLTQTSRIVQTIKTLSSHPQAHKRFISTDLHYSTIDRPICLHSEARSIAETLSAAERHNCKSHKSMVYIIAYEEALASMKEDLWVAKQRAFESAKLRVQSNASSTLSKINDMNT